MADAPRVPPLSTSAFAVTASSVVDAPPDKVWEVLMDFDSYKDWNPCIRNQLIVDASSNPLPPQPLSEGDHTLLHVNLPPTMAEPSLLGRMTILTKVTVLEPETHRVAWELASASIPSWLMRIERWQILTTQADGKTRYDTIEVSSGPLAYLAGPLLGGNLKLGLQSMADALKTRCEGRD